MLATLPFLILSTMSTLISISLKVISLYSLSLIYVLCTNLTLLSQTENKTRNSSADERANVNFLYDDIAHALGNKKEKDKTNS